MAVDGGADSQKDEGGVGRGGGRGVYTTRAFFRGSPFKFEGWARFWHRIFDKNVPGGVYAKCGKKWGFSELIHHQGIFFYRCLVVYTKTPQNMKIPYTPPGVFFGQNPGREQFLVVIFPARRQKKVPGGVYASCCLRLCPRVGTMGGQIVIELVGRLMAVF